MRTDEIPDPDGMNAERREQAEQALQLYIKTTKVDREDALCDLLCALMHWADLPANNVDFGYELERARRHHTAETGRRLYET